MRIGRLAAVLIAVFVIPTGSLSDSPPPFPNFEAKRLKPPSAGTKKRITVQIEERANPAVAPPAASIGTTPIQPEAEDGDKPVSLYDWFWAVVPAQTEKPGPGRLQDALEVMATPEGVAQLPPPRLQTMQDIATAYGRDILLSTIGTEVSPAIALAVIYTESSGNPEALSSTGAMGLMQLMPATIDRFEVGDAKTPADNIKGGVAFLDVLLRKYNGDPILALAGYNAGEGALDKFAGVPPYPETMNYVPRVLSAFTVARGLCTSPPLLASDPCVFKTIAN
ncbi:lytic transglycosylase domain-containing protein [Cognatishimia activa]|uniref:lytic transglycosylase domain-containing protein n=1 Tax=Cognatishimia activa TaxID=1715691 RepID=UPI002E8227A4|nr:lytic transglycosylase domain-containing protein [Cognatishimia activa]